VSNIIIFEKKTVAQITENVRVQFLW